jgi:hypothetical protein
MNACPQRVSQRRQLKTVQTSFASNFGFCNRRGCRIFGGDGRRMRMRDDVQGVQANRSMRSVADARPSAVQSTKTSDAEGLFRVGAWAEGRRPSCSRPPCRAPPGQAGYRDRRSCHGHAGRIPQTTGQAPNVSKTMGAEMMDQEAMGFVATTEGIKGEGVRDLMVTAVELDSVRSIDRRRLSNG